MFYIFVESGVRHHNPNPLNLYVCNSIGKSQLNVPMYYYEKFEDTKGVIRNRKLKDRQHNGQKKNDKRTINDLQTLHRKLKIE
jgi:hypothetical protein